MSGPIVRKYGFPNFDQIFGKKELEHGVDEPEATSVPSKGEPATGEKPKEKVKSKKKPGK
jgi:hypothetical protein